MGKIEDYENMFIDDGDDYLTMARHMNDEWDKWVKKNQSTYARMIGFEQAQTKEAFQSGFMAGFYARFFKQTDI